LDAVALAEFHDDIEEVHAVELELLAEVDFVIEVRQIFVGGDVAEDIEDFFTYFGGGHPGFSVA
jgi:hypothetical protein